MLQSLNDDLFLLLAHVRLDQILREEIQNVAGLYEHATLTVENVPETQVLADDRLALVFENVLRNAIEHDDTESPRLWIDGTHEDGRVQVTIADDGPGIPDAQKLHILQDGGLGAESNGTGFGLYFVRRTIDTYGGEITVEDREPRGTRVRIELQAIDG